MLDSQLRVVEILEALGQALPWLPGFRTISLFGSLAEGRADAYSDIDAIVTTDDLANAKIQLLGVLEEIGPVDFCWAINLRPDEWNPCVVFREEGYFHRLELGLADTSAVNRTIPPEQTVLLCDMPRIPARPVGESYAYAPEHGSIGHFLLGQFLGCVRYVKSRRRGHIMTCYRFAAAAMDWRLALLYARQTENPDFCSKLSTVTYLELDGLLSAAERADILSSLDFSDLRTMDGTMRSAMEGMLEDGDFLATIAGEQLPADVFGRALGFLAAELA